MLAISHDQCLLGAGRSCAIQSGEMFAEPRILDNKTCRGMAILMRWMPFSSNMDTCRHRDLFLQGRMQNPTLVFLQRQTLTSSNIQVCFSSLVLAGSKCIALSKTARSLEAEVSA